MSQLLNTNASNPDSSKEARGNRIKHIRKDILRLSRKEFANHHRDLEITESVLQNWEDGRFKGFKDNQATLLLEALKREHIFCEKNWLLHGEGEAPKIVLPGTGKHLSEKLEAEKITREIIVFKESYMDSIDAIVNDDSMEPFFTIGDHVAGLRYTGNHLNKALGHFCIVQTQQGEVLIRKVEQGSTENLYILSSFNKKSTAQNASLTDVKIFSAAPILWWRRPAHSQ